MNLQIRPRPRFARVAVSVLSVVTLVVGALLVVRIGGAAASTKPSQAARSMLTAPFKAGSPPPDTHVVLEAERFHIVRPGESLWLIAREQHRQGDIRNLVRKLALANGGVELYVGQRVRVPA